MVVFERQILRDPGYVGRFNPFELQDGKIPPAAAANMMNILMQLVHCNHGNTPLGDGSNGSAVGSLAAQNIEYLFGVADTEVVIPHGLGKVPIGYIPYRWDRAARLYDSNAGSWTETYFMLKCDTANALVAFWLF